MVNVAINGFGRIGRNTLRAAIAEGIFDKINYVAINDPGLKPEDAARIFKYDSVMGKFDGTVEAYEEGIIVNGKKIKFFAEKDPAQLPWKDLNVDVVVESTGFFTDATKAHAHIDAGAKKVVSIIFENDITNNAYENNSSDNATKALKKEDEKYFNQALLCMDIGLNPKDLRINEQIAIEYIDSFINDKKNYEKKNFHFLSSDIIEAYDEAKSDTRLQTMVVRDSNKLEDIEDSMFRGSERER